MTAPRNNLLTHVLKAVLFLMVGGALGAFSVLIIDAIDELPSHGSPAGYLVALAFGVVLLAIIIPMLTRRTDRIADQPSPGRPQPARIVLALALAVACVVTGFGVAVAGLTNPADYRASLTRAFTGTPAPPLYDAPDLDEQVTRIHREFDGHRYYRFDVTDKLISIDVVSPSRADALDSYWYSDGRFRQLSGRVATMADRSFSPDVVTADRVRCAVAAVRAKGLPDEIQSVDFRVSAFNYRLADDFRVILDSAEAIISVGVPDAYSTQTFDFDPKTCRELVRP